MRNHIVIFSFFALTLTACGSSASDTTIAADEAARNTSETTVVAPTGAVIDADGNFSITVNVGIDDYETHDGKRVSKVALGSVVTITLTDPTADQDYHLHIYDVGAQAKKGEPGQISLVLDQVGQFDVESHTTGETLLVLVVG